jgi:hypothetical protein
MTVDDLMKWIKNHVDIKNQKQIEYYLSVYRDLIDLIPTAVSIAKKHFPESHIVVDVYKDPEIEDSYIIFYIRLGQYEDSFIERLATAESELLPLLVNKKGWIQLSTDFLYINKNSSGGEECGSHCAKAPQ